MTTKPFAPKDAETIKAEILEELGVDYEGNEEMVDKIVARGLKDEQFKASLHADKEKHLEGKQKYVEYLKKAGLDPETGEKAEPVVPPKEERDTLSPKDYLALMENKVSSDEFDKVMEISRLLKKPIADTLKDKTAQLILKAQREERAAEEATATSVKTRKPGQSIKEKVIKNFEQGVKPETEEEAAELAKAQFERLLKRD